MLRSRITALLALFLIWGCGDGPDSRTGQLAAPSGNPDKGRIVVFTAPGADVPIEMRQVAVLNAPFDCDTCLIDGEYTPEGVVQWVTCTGDSLTSDGDSLWVRIKAFNSYGKWRLHASLSPTFSTLTDIYIGDFYAIQSERSGWFDLGATIGAVPPGGTVYWRVGYWDIKGVGMGCSPYSTLEFGGASGAIEYPSGVGTWDESRASLPPPPSPPPPPPPCRGCPDFED